MTREMTAAEYLTIETYRDGEKAERIRIVKIIENTEKELCTGEDGYEEFERAVKITCNNIKIMMRDANVLEDVE